MSTNELKNSGINEEGRKSSAKKKKKGKYRFTLSQLRAAGAILSLLQAIVGALFVYLLNKTGMIPWKYVMTAFAIVSAAVLLVVLLVCIRNRRTRIAAIILSVVMIIAQGVGCSYVYRTMNLLKTSESSYKTDYLNIVVRSDDSAESLAETEGYQFGIVDDLTKDEKDTLLETIRRETGKKSVDDIHYTAYSTAVEAVQALMDKKVDAAIYREAYDSVLEEVIDSFEGSVRVVENYEIRTEMEYETVEPGEPFNLLISGIDVKGDISQASRSDVNIIVTINPKTKKILMTTTPRDYYVEIPDISYGAKDKLTHAGIYGEDASIKTLENLYNIDISYYVRVNFTTLIDVVDAIDGVDVWSDYEFDCFTDDEVHIDKGWNHLNGREALAFCRERYSFPDGDNQRGKDQEAVLKAIIEKVTSPALIVNASALLDSMKGAYQTDLPESKIAELINQQLSEGTDWIIIRQAADSGGGGMMDTYSGGVLSVTLPDEYSVKKNTARMNIIFDERPEE